MRVKDLWFSGVPVRGPDGKAVRGSDGRIVTGKRKTARHPDRGGNRNAKRWLAVWSDPDGNEKTRAFAKQESARAYARKMEADAERGEYVDPKAGKGTFGELARKHLRLRDVGASSRERYDSVFRNHVEPVFGKRPVRAVRVSEIAEWLRGPLSRLSGSVQEAAYMIVAGTFDLAVADKLRRDNPARSPVIRPPRAEQSRRAVWDAATVWRVRDEHPGPYRALADCAAGLGLRRGCAFALGEEDLDFGDGKVHVRRQLAWVGGRLVFKLPKGGRERTVPLPRGVSASLRAHMAQYAPVACTLPWMNEDGTLAEDPVTVRLIFTWRGGGRDPERGPLLREKTYGKPISAASYEQGVWKPALSRAGVIPPPEKNARGIRQYRTGGAKGLGMHILRHVYETVLDEGGVSLAGQMEFLGHSRKGKVITIAVYSHVTEETFESARQAVDSRLFRLRPVAPSGTVTELRSAR
jgi:integrase